MYSRYTYYNLNGYEVLCPIFYLSSHAVWAWVAVYEEFLFHPHDDDAFASKHDDAFAVNILHMGK